MGHFALVATQVTPRVQLQQPVTLVLGQGQITAYGIQVPHAKAGTMVTAGPSASPHCPLKHICGHAVRSPGIM